MDAGTSASVGRATNGLPREGLTQTNQQSSLVLRVGKGVGYRLGNVCEMVGRTCGVVARAAFLRCFGSSESERVTEKDAGEVSIEQLKEKLGMIDASGKESLVSSDPVGANKARMKALNDLRKSLLAYQHKNPQNQEVVPLIREVEKRRVEMICKFLDQRLVDLNERFKSCKGESVDVHFIVLTDLKEQIQNKLNKTRAVVREGIEDPKLVAKIGERLGKLEKLKDRVDKKLNEVSDRMDILERSECGRFCEDWPGLKQRMAEITEKYDKLIIGVRGEDEIKNRCLDVIAKYKELKSSMFRSSWLNLRYEDEKEGSVALERRRLVGEIDENIEKLRRVMKYKQQVNEKKLKEEVNEFVEAGGDCLSELNSYFNRYGLEEYNKLDYRHEDLLAEIDLKKASLSVGYEDFCSYEFKRLVESLDLLREAVNEELEYILFKRFMNEKHGYEGKIKEISACGLSNEEMVDKYETLLRKLERYGALENKLKYKLAFDSCNELIKTIRYKIESLSQHDDRCA